MGLKLFAKDNWNTCEINVPSEESFVWELAWAACLPTRQRAGRQRQAGGGAATCHGEGESESPQTEGRVDTGLLSPLSEAHEVPG